MSKDGQRTKRRRNIVENFNRLSRAHERNGQTTDRRTDGPRHTANKPALFTGTNRLLVKTTLERPQRGEISWLSLSFLPRCM